MAGVSVTANLEELAGDDGLLWHYTDAYGLEGILRSKQLWATHYSAVNDASEVAYGRRLLLEQVADYCASHSLRGDEWQVVQSAFGGDRPQDLALFVVCFSKLKDDLSQWRAYGGASGFSLGFDVSEFGAILGTARVRLERVVYDRQEQEEMIRSRLEGLPEIVTSYRGQYFAERVNSHVRDLAMRSTVELVPFFKNPAFRAEQEVRLAVTNQVDGSIPALQPVSVPELVRVRGGRLVRYLSVAWPAETTLRDAARISLRKIVLGPTAHSTTRNDVVALLRMNRLPGVLVETSEIPLQF